MCLNKFIIIGIGCLIISIFMSCSDLLIGKIVDFRIGLDNVEFRYMGKNANISYLVSFEDSILYKKNIYAEENSYHTLPNLRQLLCGEDLSRYSNFKLLHPGEETNATYCLAYNMTKSRCDKIRYQCIQQNLILFDTIVSYNTIEKINPENLYAEIIGNEKLGTINNADYTQYLKGAKSFLIRNRIKVDNNFIHRMAQNIYSLLYYDKEIHLKIKNVAYYQETPRKNVTIQTNIDADYYYLVLCQDESELRHFVDKEIENNFTNGVYSPTSGNKILHLALTNYIQEHNYATVGINYAMLVGINNDWSYKYYPVGALIIDYVGPRLLYKNDYLLDFLTIHSTPKQIGNFYCEFDHLYNVDCTIRNITWGDFEGNNLMGYPITFIIDFEWIGDFSYIEIQHKKYKIDNFIDVSKSKRLIFTHIIPYLNIGDNYITIKYVDVRGNSTEDKINIQTQRVE